MNMHKPFEEYPRNSPENVLEVVESKIEGKYGEAMPELLSEFIKLLGNETEEWGGVKAMKKCVEDFLSWKKKFPVLKDPTWKDFQTFLFCPSRSVIVIQVGEGPVTQGVVVPKGNPEERKPTILLRNLAKLEAPLSSRSDPCNLSQSSDMANVVACSPLSIVELLILNVKKSLASLSFAFPRAESFQNYPSIPSHNHNHNH
ncbi:hypothetical protein F2Q68_00044582 [Brassica cretica]|uniref:Uncharacterized protein n=1 Tax=Brassica cretica TaxID=69181 RepID=A0A8S9LFU4_BRACR|nr:hypothetical protein F2Q68_00044582 [Brassica cretica]